MLRKALCSVCILLLVSPEAALGQSEGTGTPPAQRNSLIDEMVVLVSRERIEETVRHLAAFGTRHTLSDTVSTTRGIGAARRWVHARFDEVRVASEGRLDVRDDFFVPDSSARVPRPRPMANVVATLTGRDPVARNRVYVVSGHLDSRASDVLDGGIDAPGANDDASGVAVVLEAARVLSRFPLDATVVFIAFTGEEQGLLGSTHWATTAREQNLNVAGMITNDIVGNTRGGNGVQDKTTLRLFSEGIASNETPEQARTRASVGGENDSSSRQLARQIRRLAASHLDNFDLVLVARRDRYLRGGDHIPFNQSGYAAVRLTEPNEDYTRQHQDVREEKGIAYGDVVQGVDFEYLTQVARANVAALAGLALAPGAPEGAEILTRQLSNDTVLRWRPSGEADVTGYQVAWRATTSPDWENERFVGNVTRYTFAGVSKDNMIFGIRAVDKDGNVSPAAYPWPSREE
jgi:hypothetical protein